MGNSLKKNYGSVTGGKNGGFVMRYTGTLQKNKGT